MLSVAKAREQINIIRQRVSTPINVNFFCHTPVEADAGRAAGWRSALRLTIGNWGSIRRRP
jgi:nitronate monooxygenase